MSQDPQRPAEEALPATPQGSPAGGADLFRARPADRMEVLWQDLASFEGEIADQSAKREEAFDSLRSKIDWEAAETVGRVDSPAAMAAPPPAPPPAPSGAPAAAGGAGASAGFRPAAPVVRADPRWLAALASCLAIGALAYYGVRRSATPPPPQLQATSAPPARGPAALSLAVSNPIGLLRREGHWLMVDWLEGQLVALDGDSGEPRSRSPFPNSFTTGLGAGRDCLWSVDGFSLKILRHDPKTLQVTASVPAPGAGPSALHWDGEALWVADKKAKRLFRYKDGDLSALVAYDLADSDPVGLWRTENLVWVLDGSGKRITRYHVASSLQRSDALDVSSWLPSGSKPAGLAVHDGALWLLASSPARLYSQALQSLAWR